MDTFQNQLISLVRAFGFHRPTTTPCGRPVPIADAHALMELSACEALPQRELGTRLNLRKSTVSRLVSNLEGRGWVERRRNATDRRVREVRLTPAGEQAATDLAQARKAKMDRVLSRIPADQRETVTLSLRTLIEAIHESDD